MAGSGCWGPSGRGCCPSGAEEAASGRVRRVQNRPGNIHGGKGAGRFLRDLFAQLRATLGAVYRLEFRMDGAFFRRDILDRLERAGAEYAIKVPFHPWLGLKGRVLQTRTWTRLTDDVTCAEHKVEVACWQRRWRRVVSRRHLGQ